MSKTNLASAGRACPVCGGPVPSQPGAGRPGIYCSSRCKSRAARQRRAGRALSLKPAAKASEPSGVDERVRIVRTMSREAAIGLVAADPDALHAALTRASPMIASPAHRATRWGDVAAMIGRLAAMIPDA